MGRAQGQTRGVVRADFDRLLGARRGSGRPDSKRADHQPISYAWSSAPSQLARTVANQVWKDVQQQQKVAEGIYGFSCAGHGGVIAVIGKAKLDPVHVQAAREDGLTELVVRSAGKTYSTAAGYSREDVSGLIANHPDLPHAEVWVGEEDVAWATIFYEQPELLAAAQRSGYFSESLSSELVAGCVTRNQESFIAALYPDYKPVADGQLDRERRRKKLLEAGEFLRSSAVGEGTGEHYRVKVSFRNAAGEERECVMSKATYAAIPLGVAATAGDYRQHGEVTER